MIVIVDYGPGYHSAGPPARSMVLVSEENG